ncbi:MAG: tetratricopeptide repeat protein [Planctomycetes bacterium]|nr:tetratricopeptide repeat protein [Planctomycetota bacterium]MCB9886989.1 tetratricopeptide repeat protein [Planctomycetota bacterium]
MPLPAGQRLALLLIWLVAAVPPALWLVSRSDPDLAVQLVHRGTVWVTRLALGAGAVLALAALLFPPVPAWLRLRWNELRLSLTSDRGPLLRAMGELEHFASAQRHYEVGRLALLRREFSLALPHLQAALEMEPDMAAAHHHLGLAMFRHGQLGVAAAAFARAEELDPGHAFGDALLYLGRCLDLADHHQQAVEVLRKHQARHGGGHRSHYWLGLALLAAGDAHGAADAFAVAAAPPAQKITAEENWFRALARVRRWRGGAS